MPKPKAKSKRVRLRPGVVMVELSEAERVTLEQFRDNRRIATGERVTLAGAFRYLLREATR